MVCEKNVIKAIKTALEKTDKNYCELSQLIYSESGAGMNGQKRLKKKFLERPFAYEFYHQLRKLMDERVVDFGEPVVQAEVSKKYQCIFTGGKTPDFIIHIPNTHQNLAVIEFKLAFNRKGIEKDLKTPRV